MNTQGEVPEQSTIDTWFARLNADAESGGYHLNPDMEMTSDLIRGLIINNERYGYPSCPCRLSSGRADEDRDIVCPCDYRDADVLEHNACYCGLYVSGAVVRGDAHATAIPERRPPPEKRSKVTGEPSRGATQPLAYPVYRCTVCGYLCARDEPPEKCPICKVSKDRFELFISRG